LALSGGIAAHGRTSFVKRFFIFKMELNKIYNECCLKTMAKMPDGFVDLVVTSPPYDDLRDYNGINFPFEKIANELFRIVNDNGVLVWIVADSTKNGSESGTSFRQALYFQSIGFGIYDTMIYQKIGTASPQKPEIRYKHSFEYMFVFCKGRRPKHINLLKQKNKERRRQIETASKVQKNGSILLNTYHISEESVLPNVWLVDATNGARESSRIHPAAFPEILPERHILTWTKVGDTVYDPFGGSGTTAKMAHKHQRNWLLSEISADYCVSSEKRLRPHLSTLSLFTCV